METCQGNNQQGLAPAADGGKAFIHEQQKRNGLSNEPMFHGAGPGEDDTELIDMLFDDFDKSDMPMNFTELLDFDYIQGGEGGKVPPSDHRMPSGYSCGPEAHQYVDMPDFNDTSHRSLEPPRSENQAKNLKLKFREYSRPVPESYYRSRSFHHGAGYARKDSMNAMIDGCYDQQDYLQSSPNQSIMSSQDMLGKPPGRSMSCPDSHVSGQDTYQAYGNQVHFSSARGMEYGDAKPKLYNTSSFSSGGHPQYQIYDEKIERERRAYASAQGNKVPKELAVNGIIHTGTVISGGGGGREIQTEKRILNSTAAKPPPPQKTKSGRSQNPAKGAAGKPDSPKKSTIMRSSKYRGVTKHRRSGRWEAHIWVRETGKQVYLGGYELEEHAAEAYDVAALKCKGKKVKTNFDISKYGELLQYMDTISLEELVMAVRRQSQGFARGSSKYRGVTRHPNGRWEARIGMPGSRHIYLGLYNDEADAAKSYDRALVKLRGSQAATNFALSNYTEQLREYHTEQQKEILYKSNQEVLNNDSGLKKQIPLHLSANSPSPAAIAEHATHCI